MTNRILHESLQNKTESKTRLVFFDMDHTILNASKYHRQTIANLLSKFFGVNELPRVMTSGYPYIEVIRKYAIEAGVGDDFFSSKLAEIEKYVVENMVASLPDDMGFCIYPGAIALLEKLSQANIFLGITTGTLREIAVPLLQRTGLLSFFPLQALAIR